MATANPTREGLSEFLEYLSRKGLMNKTTASARKAAANQVLSILEDREAEDLSKIDLDAVMGRFHNLMGQKYTPASLNTYRSRVKAAIDDYIRYQNDPLNFRPSSQSAQRKSDRPKSATTGDAVPVKPMQMSAIPEPPQASVNILPIPIRPDLTVKIQGLPFDLTAQEAAKIANVVKAMAQD